MTKCEKVAKSSGKRCRNNAKDGSKFCGSHGGDTGRPTIVPSTVYAKTDDGVQTYGDTVIDLIRIGLKPWKAARRLKLSPITIESWIERGEAGLQQNKPDEFVEFVVGLEAARLDLETQALTTLYKAIRSGDDKLGDPGYALKMIERLDPAEWSPTHKVEHSGEVNVVQQHAEQLLAPVMAILTELDVADDPRVPDLIEQYFAPLEARQEI